VVFDNRINLERKEAEVKRRWWLWLLLAIACITILVAVSELTGISLVSLIGLGILGPLGIVLLILSLIMVVFFALAGAWLVKVLLESFISNREKLSITLGTLGFCAILVGYILTVREFEWSLFVVTVGFLMGCLAGAEYQRFLEGSEKE